MAILAAVLVPTITSKIKQANESSANSEASSYANSIKTDIIALQSNITSNLDLLKKLDAVANTEGNKSIDLGTESAHIYAQFDAAKLTDMKKDNTTFSSDGTKFTVSTTVGGVTVTYTVDNTGKVTNTTPTA